MVLRDIWHQKRHGYHLFEDRQQHLVDDWKLFDGLFEARRAAIFDLRHELFDEGAVLPVSKVRVFELPDLKFFLLHQLPPHHLRIVFLLVLQLQSQPHETKVEGADKGGVARELPYGSLGREQVLLEEGGDLDGRVVEWGCLLGSYLELLERFDLLEHRLG